MLSLLEHKTSCFLTDVSRIVSTLSESEPVPSISASVHCTLRTSAIMLGSGMVSGIAAAGLGPLGLSSVLGCTTQEP